MILMALLESSWRLPTPRFMFVSLTLSSLSLLIPLLLLLQKKILVLRIIHLSICYELFLLLIRGWVEYYLFRRHHKLLLRDLLRRKHWVPLRSHVRWLKWLHLNHSLIRRIVLRLSHHQIFFKASWLEPVISFTKIRFTSHYLMLR